MSEPRQIVNLGMVDDPHAQRDAIHIAVAPMVAGEMLRPGQHVGILGTMEHDEFDCPVAMPSGSSQVIESIGIVDPFLQRPVMKGQRFNMLLYPNTITSLRHEWTHPAFESQN